MTDNEYREAADYWKKHDEGTVKMPADLLKKEAEAYIEANDTCALATGFGKFIRCTPIEYMYFDGAFWMFTEGGEKFTGLKDNPAVCIAIFDRYGGFGKLKGMQVSGKAELPELFSEVYNRAAERKKIPPEALKKLNHPMYLIKIVPEKIEFLNSDFKNKGFDSRQTWFLI
jgi:hypothetical protein